jgi:sugar O-acyltransferase (sialic acid O-acetyltransferase NeuD family)
MSSPDLRPVIVYGAGYPDTVKLIARLSRVEQGWKIHGFIDDMTTQHQCLEIPVLGGREILQNMDIAGFRFVNNVFSSMKARARVSDVLESHHCDVISLIDPEVDTMYSEIGKGVVIQKGAQLGSRVRIGAYCAVRMNAVVNHDNTLGDYVFIGPGVTLCGYVSIGTGSYIGAGSVVKERITIGGNATVGAGSVVVRDVPDAVVVAGVPAKEMIKLE